VIRVPTRAPIEAAKKGGAIKKDAKGGATIGEHQGMAGLKKGASGRGEHPIQERGKTRAEAISMSGEKMLKR
jgi:hypothetical protein